MPLFTFSSILLLFSLLYRMQMVDKAIARSSNELSGHWIELLQSIPEILLVFRSYREEHGGIGFIYFLHKKDLFLLCRTVFAAA